MALNGSCFMVTWIIFQYHFLEVGLTQKPGEHGSPNTHNHVYYGMRARVNKSSLK